MVNDSDLQPCLYSISIADLSYKDLILTAMAMAISDSVTVSMGELTSGARSVMLLVSGELRSTSSAAKFM